MIPWVESFSTVKKMFEEGARLRAEYGDDKVFDFSLGNPDIPAPKQFKQALRELIEQESTGHGYTPNSGHPAVRQAVAGYLSQEYELDITPESVMMTVGAAGALNCILRALINPGEEILVPAPYFIGYQQYVFGAGARLKAAATDGRFHLDLEAIEAGISAKTRVMLINSPNNPTGAIYGADELAGLGEVLEKASQNYGRRIYLVSDEPYRKIAYDTAVPSVFAAYPHTVVVNSYSKSLSLAGERIGYLAIQPQAEDARQIMAAAEVANTMLYVNAPGLFQMAVAKTQGVTVDIEVYRRRRDMFCQVLSEAGYEFQMPEGAFYLFPQSPIRDDVEFVGILADELILAVPGAGFGARGYFRLSYAVPDAVIAGSSEGFKRAREKAVA